MVKPDASRDYYADLSCGKDADAAELKKAFRKLALKYHPDRNIGNEVQANQKFQDIQQAHEVLTDPEKRAKYDADRLKQTLFGPKQKPSGAPDPPPRSPYGVPTNFPPPPRRTQPQPQPQPQPGRYPGSRTAANGGAMPSGANRYSGYNFDRSQQDAWRKADAQQKSTAWDQMRKPGYQGTTGNDRSWSNQFAPPPRRVPKQYPDGKTGKQRGGWDSDTPTPPRPAPKAFPEKPVPPPGPGMQRSNTMRSPRKPGFFTAAGVGDEPPARNASAYYHVSQGQKPQASRPQSYHPPSSSYVPHQDRSNPDSSRSFKPKPQGDDSLTGDRLSTPYATAGGEKTYFNTDHFQRSSSHASNLHAGWDGNSARTSPRSPDVSSGRHRSASPHLRSPRPEDEPNNYDWTSSSSSCSSEDDDDDDDDDNDDVGDGDGDGGEGEGEGEGEDGPRERVKLKPKARNPRRASANHAGARSSVENPSVTVESDSGSDPAPSRPRHRSTWSDEVSKSGMAEGLQQQFSRSQPGSRKSSSGNLPPGHGFAHSRAGKPDAHPPPSPLSSQPPWSNDEKIKPLEKSQSWQEKFGSAKDGTTRFERPSTGGRVNQKPDFFIPTTDSSSSTTPMRESSAENAHTKFSSEDWQGKFDNAGDYLSPQNGARGVSRGRSPPKRPNPQNVFVRSANGEGITKTQPQSTESFTAEASTPSVEQKDDNRNSKEDWSKYFEPPTFTYTSPEKSGGINRRTKTPQKMSTANRRPPAIPKNPTVTNPEDEAAATLSTSSSSSAMDIDNTPPPPMEETKTKVQIDPIADIIRGAVPPPSPKPELDANGDDDIINLKTFKNTIPFAPNANGLADMGDLEATLPFDSQASTTTIPGRTVSPLRLELPKKPRAPMAPDVDTLTKETWSQYTKQFTAYLKEWNSFNARMISHFQARNQKEKELPEDLFLPSANTSFQEYQSGIEEDFRVRTHWEVSCVMHRDVVKQLADLRRAAAAEHLDDD